MGIRINVNGREIDPSADDAREQLAAGGVTFGGTVGGGTVTGVTGGTVTGSVVLGSSDEED
ncbi:hypothetical protein [Streptomyces sp. WMMB303]|uniref:hypothetical protein n=1 Tax=Streptomyces sp. WMMB303 TaxID=3034154 RepID=UPI0023EDCB80|nr:hypothetical protein [Streptomyces sp. WMMB303]MDF4254598.1 hypothetical protein [Streptomyces sp. WMMB303]